MVRLEVGWCCYVGQGADHHGCCVVAAAETTSQNDVLIYTAPVAVRAWQRAAVGMSADAAKEWLLKTAQTLSII